MNGNEDLARRTEPIIVVTVRPTVVVTVEDARVRAIVIVARRDDGIAQIMTSPKAFLLLRSGALLQTIL